MMQEVRVLDLTRVLAGPWATQHLADQGAQVIKVEPPSGDETRGFGPIVHGESTYYLSANRDKRSIVLDLKTAAGREVLDALLDHTDLVVENFRPGVADRLGLGWERLHARWPRLIYVAIHAFGDDTPGWSERPGYDLLLQHLSGATSLTGWPGDPPTKCATSTADLFAGLYATQAALHGLLHREWTGEGQRIVVNMLQAQATCLTYHAARYAVTGQVDTQRGNAHAGIVPYDVFRCTDGWLVIACANDGQWRRLRSALDLDDCAGWRNNVDRVADRAAVSAAVQEAIGALTVERADATLRAAGVPAGPVLRPDQTLAHPAVHRVTVEHPVLGPIALPGPAFQTASTRTTHRPPPGLGADRDEVLATVGLAEDLERLRDAGAFGQSG